GLHPQLVHYNLQLFDGSVVGKNQISTVKPGDQIKYQWYAGVIDIPSNIQSCESYSGADRKKQYSLLNMFAQFNEKGTPLRSPAHLVSEEYVKKIVINLLRSPEKSVGINTLDKIESIEELDVINQASQLITDRLVTNNLVGLLDILNKFLNGFGCFETPVVKNETQSEIERASQIQSLLSSENQKDLSVLLQRYSNLDSNDKIFDPLNNLRNRLACTDRLLGSNDLFTSLGRIIGADEVIEFINQLAAHLVFQVAKISPETNLNESYRLLKQYLSGDHIDETLSESNLRLVSLNDGACRYVPVEFGATNLSPPDRIKQGQKAAVGALIIEPEKSFWIENLDDQAIDRQNPGANQSSKRATRATATVFYPSGERRPPFNSNWRFFRDLVMVHQKGLNLRYADGSAVANLAAEKEKMISEKHPDPSIDKLLRNHPDHWLNTAPEDAHDSGHMAINYGAEPMWFRYGLPPDAPFGKQGFGGAASAWEAFSNDCCSNRTAGTGGTVISADVKKVGEPYVPVMTAYAGQEMRIRALMPTGVGRAST
ncbi:hypothetical protein, partial [Nitrosomonas sp.]|uniref:hypothetical protein n=1 Tax=Nitrosomonas sp. TaxID=42353 RepID=UPI0035ADA1EF